MTAFFTFVLPVLFLAVLLIIYKTKGFDWVSGSISDLNTVDNRKVFFRSWLITFVVIQIVLISNFYSLSMSSLIIFMLLVGFSLFFSSNSLYHVVPMVFLTFYLIYVMALISSSYYILIAITLLATIGMFYLCYRIYLGHRFNTKFKYWLLEVILVAMLILWVHKFRNILDSFKEL